MTSICTHLWKIIFRYTYFEYLKMLYNYNEINTVKPPLNTPPQSCSLPFTLRRNNSHEVIKYPPHIWFTYYLWISIHNARYYFKWCKCGVDYNTLEIFHWFPNVFRMIDPASLAEHMEQDTWRSCYKTLQAFINTHTPPNKSG